MTAQRPARRKSPGKPGSFKTIVWDVDDVLNALTRAWFQQEWLPRHSECTLQYEDIRENPPHKLLGVSFNNYLQSLDAFRLSPQCKELPPTPEVLAWFKRHGERFRHIVLTAPPLVAAASSAAWVLGHYGKWIRSFNFVPSVRKNCPVPMIDKSKEDYLRWWRQADILADDNSDNIEAAHGLGLQAILIPQPWNRAKGTLKDALAALSKL